MMNNVRMAELLSDFTYFLGEEDSFEFAVKLFIEGVVLPKEIEEYTQNELKEHILKYLNKTR